MYIKKKSSVRERERKKNHRWNNDAYCIIIYRERIIDIQIFTKEKEDMKLFLNVIHKNEKEKKK